MTCRIIQQLSINMNFSEQKTNVIGLICANKLPYKNENPSEFTNISVCNMHEFRKWKILGSILN